MSAGESGVRLRNSRVQPDYWWFDLTDDDLVAMFEMWEKMGGSDAAGQLRAVPGLDAEGRPDLHLVLVDADGDMCGQYNTSHPCPPICE